MDPTTQTLTTLRDAIAANKLTATDATRAYLDRIATHDETLGACNDVFNERALARAAAVDAGEVTGPLAGVPVIIKDNIVVSYGRTTCSSKMLADFESPYDATVVEKLEAAGAVVLAKANMDEFAMGSSTESSVTRPARNPWDTTRVPGGSSGGSAVAVAADLCAAAVGSDTGGSIRQPAALCGVVGLKPTYGRVSRFGLVAYGSSLDQIGPITRSVPDAAALLNVIAGYDEKDSTSANTQTPDFTTDLDTPVEGLRLGIARQYMSEHNDPAIAAAIDNAVAFYKDAGATIVDVDLPHTDYGIPAYYVIATSEASSNLARYDGVHYGHRTASPDDLIDLYAASRAEGFGDEVKRRIMLGTYALSSGYYDAYYLRAQKVRRLIKQDFDRAFDGTNIDAIVCPTTPHPAWKIGEKTDDPLTMYLEDIYTVGANLAGIPGISIPCGTTDPTTDAPALPIGLQLLGPQFAEARLLRIARQFERAHPRNDPRNDPRIHPDGSPHPSPAAS